jgi:hypothetical protein
MSRAQRCHCDLRDAFLTRFGPRAPVSTRPVHGYATRSARRGHAGRAGERRGGTDGAGRHGWRGATQSSTIERPFCGQLCQGPWKGAASTVDDAARNVDKRLASVDRRCRAWMRPKPICCDAITHHTTTCCGLGLDRHSPASYCWQVAPAPDDPRHTPGNTAEPPPEGPREHRHQGDPTDGSAATRHPIP